MSKEFKLPDLGEGIESGDVVAVHVSEGDTIEEEQTVLEIETDKAVLEVPCPFAGRVEKVHVNQGDNVSVGATLISVDIDGGAERGGEKEEGEESEAEEPEEPQEEPEAGDEEAEEGEEEEEAAAEQEEEPAKKPAARKKKEREQEKPFDRTDKEEGRKKKEKKKKPPHEQPDEEAEEREEAEAPAPEAPTIADPSEPVPTWAGPTPEKPIPAGPATRRLARELGVSLESVAAAYPGVRLTEDHIKGYVREGRGRAAPKDESAAKRRDAGVSAPSLPDFTQWGEIERKPLSSLERKSAEHLAVGWIAPHVTQFDEADITALETLRKRYRETEKGKEAKLTVTAFVLKAVAIALKSMPRLNASLDTASNELVLKRYYHIGVAVDTEAGLIVPVIRDVDRKRVLDIATEMAEVAERTRRRKIELEALRGGTFTVTNLGGIGGTAFTPVINHPEVAILGLGRHRPTPFLENGQLANRLMLPLCLSYDHRVVNGADGARFTRKVATLLEDPELLLLKG